MKKTGVSSLAALLVCAAVPSASAHTGFDRVDGLISGCAHPLTGWDHLLAMVAVGLWAAQLGGQARWLLPVAFVGVMALSACAAQAGWQLPQLESGIAASILALGLLIATASRVPTAAGVGLVALFATFHGLAHGAEMPPDANGAVYGLGFIATTALLHCAGLLSSEGLKKALARLPKFIGWSLAAAGFALALN